ncbi:MAG: hypothetical protein EBT83_11635 [Betaproteobacteria bacterium]|nr:hypothetical protein [Betaproteobacteria bacterium]
MKLATLRWMAIAPAILLAWVAAFAIGIRLLDVARRFCPPEAMISGTCTVRWYAPTEMAIMALSTALAALFIVGISVWLAPSHRALVAKLVTAGGIAYAIYFAVQTGLWLCFGTAAAAAVATCWRVVLNESRFSPTSSSHQTTSSGESRP